MYRQTIGSSKFKGLNVESFFKWTRTKTVLVSFLCSLVYISYIWIKSKFVAVPLLGTDATSDFTTAWVKYSEAAPNASFQCHECDKQVGSKKAIKIHLSTLHSKELDDKEDSVLQVCDAQILSKYLCHVPKKTHEYQI